ncbi:MAG: endoribonuclease MazF [Bacteroidales bacterium]|nr:endoribonuclease MazF [Bacteroidales bacterium]
MVDKNYIPEKGDLVWINFTPQSGHEQAGKRPAIIISPKLYNQRTSLCIACPVTSKIKGYPFEVIVNGNNITGVVLVDQIKSLDWKAKGVSFIEKIKTACYKELEEKLQLLLFS